MYYAIIEDRYEPTVFQGETKEKLDSEIKDWLDSNLELSASVEIIYVEEATKKLVTFDYIWTTLSECKSPTSTARKSNSVEV